METETPAKTRTILVCLVGLAMLQGAMSLYRTQTLTTVYNYDPAWYYQVARNFARGRGLTEITLWHYLDPPPQVVRPAGDYWSPGWALALGVLMKGCGDSESAALHITAVVSSLLPVGVFLLTLEIGGALWPALLAGLMVIFTPALDFARVLPDCQLAYLETTVFGYWAFLRARRLNQPIQWVVAGLVLSLPVQIRGEGFIPFGVCLFTMLLMPPAGKRWRCMLFLAGGLLMGLLPYLMYNVVCFGRLMPYPRTLTPWLFDYNQLYAIVLRPSFDSFARAWTWSRASMILWLSLQSHARALDNLPWPRLVLGLAAMGVLMYKRSPGGVVLLLSLLGTLAIMCSLVPWVAAPDRFMRLAAVMLSCAAAFGAWTLGRGRPLPTLVLCLLATFVYWPMATPPPTDWTNFQRRPSYLFDPQVAALHLTQQDLILTDEPMQVSMELDVPTLRTPSDQLLPVFARYHPDYVIIGPGSFLSPLRDAGFPGLPMTLQKLFTIDGVEWYRVISSASK